MISQDQADKLANEHVAEMPEPAQGYRFSRSKRVRVEHGWYYDYQILCELEIPESQQEKFAGAFGFVVEAKTGAISELNHSQWVDLGLAFHENPYGS